MRGLHRSLEFFPSGNAADAGLCTMSWSGSQCDIALHVSTLVCFREGLAHHVYPSSSFASCRLDLQDSRCYESWLTVSAVSLPEFDMKQSSLYRLALHLQFARVERAHVSLDTVGLSESI
jgi:hypothetical protein